MNKALKKLLPYIFTDAGQLSTGEKLRSGLAAFGGIFLVGWVSSFFITGAGLPLIVASMGASAALLFAASHSPLAQPWPLVGGNIISALVGVTVAKFMPDPVLGAAFAVSLSVLIMLLTHSLHPPGGGISEMRLDERLD